MPLFLKLTRINQRQCNSAYADETIDRTTTLGKLSDYNYDELLSIRLKDHEGNITATMIPKLEVFDWSKG